MRLIQILSSAFRKKVSSANV